ncbi:Uncharacterised protein [Listeria grayi]|uniref:Uncharacterized protein n=1 Tax=Listeria grayi TaxID=1641 RepID=A0A378MHC4_LISGR|nr:Uncharacterised protein [Listeria grayi]
MKIRKRPFKYIISVEKTILQKNKYERMICVKIASWEANTLAKKQQNLSAIIAAMNPRNGWGNVRAAENGIKW